MPAPTLTDYQQSSFVDAAANEVTPTVTWAAGDFIVVAGVTEDNTSRTLGVPTATGLSFSEWVSSNTGSNCKGYVWTATAAGSGSGAITSLSGGGGDNSGIAAFVYSGSGGRGATGSIISSAATVISLIRASDSSAVICVMGDWAAINDAAVTNEPASGGTQRVNAANGWLSGQYAAWLFNWTNQGVAGTTNYGMTAHAGGVTMAGFALEIKGLPDSAAGLRPNVSKFPKPRLVKAY